MRKAASFVILFLLSTAVFAARFYVDPSVGDMNNDGSSASPWSTLADVISQDKIESFHFLPLPYSASSQLTLFNQGAPVQAGDTLILRNGLHGNVYIRGYFNAKPIIVMAEAGHSPILNNLHVVAGRNWVFQGLFISSEPYGNYLNNKLVFLESHGWHGSCSQIEVSDCQIYSTDTPWSSANDWLTKVSSGIFVKGDSVLLKNNKITNVSFGIQLVGDSNQAIGNDIVNFSSDGARILGSSNLFDGNLIKNCYKVDDNHDDGIQSFTTTGLVVDNNIVSNNIILNYDDSNQPLLGAMQGIGCFDGFYNNWDIVNNLIVVDHWHGISFYGAKNCSIINNTVLDPTPNITPGPSWIKVTDKKNGEPSSGCIIKNNVANSFAIDDGVQGNNMVLSTLVDYQNHFVDPTQHDFNLLSTSTLVDAGDAIVAPMYDINGTSRTNGLGPDIGAYEYNFMVGDVESLSENKIVITPNPVSDYINLVGNVKGNIYVFTADGLLVEEVKGNGAITKISLGDLPSGVYFIAFRNAYKGVLKVEKVIIE